jgi:hypothetical protein
MRLASFAPEGTTDTEVYITVLAGSGGGLRPNLDRWRDQMGLPAMSEAEFGGLLREKILGTEAVFCTFEGSFTGMGGAPRENWMLLGMALDRGGDSVFVKMTGPADVVRGEQDRFRAFCESFHE